MRRRWLLIVSGIFAVGVAAVLIRAFYFPPPPFEFLIGQEPLTRWGPGAEDWHYVPGRTLVYSYKADFSEVVRLAGEELRGKGFKMRDIGGLTPEQYGMAPFAKGLGPEHENVLIVKDQRMEEVSRIAKERTFWYSDPGWVTVQVNPPKSRGAWDKILAFFGL